MTKIEEVTVYFNTKEITFKHVKCCVLKADIGLLEIFTADKHICICVDKATYYEEKKEVKE